MSAARLRLVSYNVRDLLDDREAVAHVLRSLRADVVCLQEAPRRWFDVHRLRRLALVTGLAQVAGGRWGGGTAVLVHPRLSVVHAETRRLPVAGALTRTRGYALATVAAPDGARVTAVSVHLPLREAERVDHSRRVLAGLRAVGPPPYVVAGDLNEAADGPAWTTLGACVRDGADAVARQPTYPAHRPRHRIDAVLVSAGFDVRVRVAGAVDGLDAEVLSAASDHLPLVAELVLE